MPIDLSSEAQRKRANDYWGGLAGKVERFLSRTKIIDGECWEWLGAYSGNGPYGVCRDLSGKSTSAHRVAFQLFKGNLLEGSQIMHSCDNPRCVNPAHLSQGTAQDNADDKVSKGRQSKSNTLPDQRGEGNLNSKTCVDTVLEIRKLYAEGVSQKEIASMTGVQRANVWAIVHRKSWRHI